jgi:hypothetical protein
MNYTKRFLGYKMDLTYAALSKCVFLYSDTWNIIPTHMFMAHYYI